MKKITYIEIKKTSYNVWKIWGGILLFLNSIALYLTYIHNDSSTAIFSSIGIISGAILITTSKGKIIVKNKKKIPINDN